MKRADVEDGDQSLADQMMLINGQEGESRLACWLCTKVARNRCSGLICHCSMGDGKSKMGEIDEEKIGSLDYLMGIT